MANFLTTKYKTTEKDHILFWTVIILISFGLLMIYSASGTTFGLKLFLKQLVYSIIGLSLIFYFSNFNYFKLKKIIIPLLFITVILLCLTFLFEVRKTHRWIKIFFISFQPSELAKLTILFFLANYIDSKASIINNFKKCFLPMTMVVFTISGIIFLQPDYGSSIFIIFLFLIMCFIGKIKKLYLAGLLLVFLFIGITGIFVKGYRIERLKTFLNPWTDKTKSGYQIVHSLLAFGSGGVFGKGLGEGEFKLKYLPDLHSDFIFPIVGEELGFVGCIFLIGIYLLIFYRGLKIAIKSPDFFSYLLAAGITIIITSQALLHMLVTTALLPTKGLPLPFFSAGGSSLLVLSIMVGILLNISSFKTKRYYSKF